MTPGRESVTEWGSPERYDDLLAVLADSDRRQLLRTLRAADGSLSIQQLVEELSDRTEDTDRRLRSELVHNHLPKLQTADLISAGETDGEVSVDELTPMALTVLDLDPEERPKGLKEQTSSVPPESGSTVQSPIEKLSEQKRMFSTLVSNLPGMAYRCQNEPDWPMSFVSEGCQKLTGHDPGEIEQGVVSWGKDIIHPDDVEMVWETVQSAVDNREPFEITYRIHRADGTVRWVWEQGCGIFDNGTVEALEGFIADVTERKQRERDLARFKRAVEAAGHSIYMTDPDGIITYVNPTFEEMTGYKEEEVLGKSPAILDSDVHDDEYFEDLWETIAAGERWEEEIINERKDGTQYTAHQIISPVTNAEGEIDQFAAIQTDISKRKERKRRLEAVFDGSFQYMGLLEPDGTLLEINAAALDLGGLDRKDVIGDPLWETPWWQTDRETRLDLREGIQRAGNGEFVRQRATIEGDNREATIDFSLQPVRDDDGDVELLVAEGRDVTEHIRREEQLEALHEVATRLLKATTPEAVCERAVGTVQEILDLELAAVKLFDESEASLQLATRSNAVTRLTDDGLLFEDDRSVAWDVFAEQDATIAEHVATHPDIDDETTPLESAMVLPLGTHGVLVVGSTESAAFSEVDVEVANILAAQVETSLDSIVRESRLRERRETLEEKNEQLTQQNTLNDVIRSLLGSIIGASSREEILRTACENLASAGPYRFAWIGSQDAVTETVQPDARAGVEDGYLDAVSVPATVEQGGEPAGRALQREEMVVDEVRTDPPFEPWQKAALDRGYHTVIAIPLVYEGARYGVLAIYAAETDRFDSLEQSVLGELGEAIAYAITAAQRKQALMSERVVELEYSLSEPDTPLLRCARSVDGTLTLEGIVQKGNGDFSAFVALRDGSTAELLETCESEPDVSDIHVVTEHESETLYECVLSGSGLLAMVFDHGGVPQELTAEAGDVQIALELPAVRDVREFDETITERFPSASLVARHEHDRQPQTTVGFRQQLEEFLTERNLEVLEKAYYNGFFEWPRENSGEEVAASLDIAQPTFNRHLRNAERTLLELLLEGESEGT